MSGRKKGQKTKKRTEQVATGVEQTTLSRHGEIVTITRYSSDALPSHEAQKPRTDGPLEVPTKDNFMLLRARHYQDEARDVLSEMGLPNEEPVIWGHDLKAIAAGAQAAEMLAKCAGNWPHEWQGQGSLLGFLKHTGATLLDDESLAADIILQAEIICDAAKNLNMRLLAMEGLTRKRELLFRFSAGDKARAATASRKRKPGWTDAMESLAERMARKYPGKSARFIFDRLERETADDDVELSGDADTLYGRDPVTGEGCSLSFERWRQYFRKARK